VVSGGSRCGGGGEVNESPPRSVRSAETLRFRLTGAADLAAILLKTAWRSCSCRASLKDGPPGGAGGHAAACETGCRRTAAQIAHARFSKGCLRDRPAAQAAHGWSSLMLEATLGPRTDEALQHHRRRPQRRLAAAGEDHTPSSASAITWRGDSHRVSIAEGHASLIVREDPPARINNDAATTDPSSASWGRAEGWRR
jgi:hypothetical protein